jgi:hypothetical protein
MTLFLIAHLFDKLKMLAMWEQVFVCHRILWEGSDSIKAAPTLAKDEIVQLIIDNMLLETIELQKVG